MITAILPAAGSSRRFGGDDKKIFQEIAGHPVWFHAAGCIAAMNDVDSMVLVVSPEDRERFQAQHSRLDNLAEMLGRRPLIVNGGAQRYDSVRAGLLAACRCVLGASAEGPAEDASGQQFPGEDFPGDDLPADRFVAVHDAARPHVMASDLRRLFDSARENGAALLAAPVRGTLKRWSADVSDAGCQTVDRSGMWEALTPQVFRIGLLVRAYQRWRGRPVTDDAQIVERSGHAVQIVQGSADNIKITRREDLALVAAKMLSEE